MSSQATPLGRRERNKQQKLERIRAAAAELFTAHGIDDVTTQQIAEKADVGTGTLFLYAKTKGELLLLVQNVHYAAALETGRQAAARAESTLDATMALLRPIIECNRVQVENGRTYLREMVFGNPADAHHAEALRIVGETETALTDILKRDPRIDDQHAPTLARMVSAAMFVTMAAGVNAEASIDDITDDVRTQVEALLDR
ncbi:TetR/AcrR family transcriptional regulator [Microbacterium foliorum]|uniref:Bacterial regulatory protein, tetR family n=1 Tax=Microbacterium foliorum TaxID=104336 RepID=A0A0F0KT43_9MICO|nr:TetR/AcrR family transcriptional regulator [Microbacterium foliorum]AXL13046.1 TetR/AcrR family transcriptional regulator [Microbacterium foliorum]KJL22396.1 Bacterial regulatory protein, tetR family [Microbacterium foliorum]